LDVSDRPLIERLEVVDRRATSVLAERAHLRDEAREVRASDALGRGRPHRFHRSCYGRFEGAVTREVSLKKRAAFGQVVPPPPSSPTRPPPRPAPRPPALNTAALSSARALCAPRPPAPPPRPSRPAARSARSRVMNDGSSDAR